MSPSTSKAIATAAIWASTLCALGALFGNIENIDPTSGEKGWVYLGMLVAVAATVSTGFVWKGGSGE